MYTLLFFFYNGFLMKYLLDVSWLLYSGYFSTSKVWGEHPEIHFLCRKMEWLLCQKDAELYLCLDGCDTKGKKLLGDDYKSGRNESAKQNVYQALYTFISLLNNKRIHVCYNSEYESDEIIYTLSRTLEGDKCIVSGDKDLLQSINEQVSVDNRSDKIITESIYYERYGDLFFGIEPRKLPLYRAIVGDASDTLKPPVHRFPRKLAAKITKDFNYQGYLPTKEELMSLSEKYTVSEKKKVSALIDAYDKFKTNFDIMKLTVITEDIYKTYRGNIISLSDFLTGKIKRLNAL